MKDIRNRVETSKRRTGTVVLIVSLLLLSAALGWADTTIYVYQAANGGLTVKTFDCNGTLSQTIQQTNAIPKSCFLPELFWDTFTGSLRINGFDSSGTPSWTGMIGVDGKLKNPASGNVNVTCGSVTPDAISGVFPDSIPCVSYSAWSACSNGFITRTGSPAGCEGQILSIPCSNTSTCSWTYGAWTPATCAAGSIQTRTATASPSGCTGFPGEPTIQSCPAAPVACTSWTYSAWSPLDGSCTPGSTQTRTVTGSSPAGCTGSPSPSNLSKTCNAPICTSWTYSAWSPSEATCTAGQTLTRTISTSSPAGCTGGNPVLSEACPNGSNGLQGTTLLFNVNTQHFPLTAGQAKLFNVTAPACTTTAKQLRFTLGGQQSYPRSDVLVKKVNGNPSRVPTQADYNAYYALTARGVGPYMDCVSNGDGTCTSTGSFFWKFDGSGSGETVIVYSSYSNFSLGAPISMKTSIPTFSQGDSYYLYVVNTSATASTDVYVRAYCY